MGDMALGWGAHPAFVYRTPGNATIDVPLAAGLCPVCHLVSLWSMPSEALRSVLQLNADTNLTHERT